VEKDQALNIVFEDKDVLAVEKPPFLVVFPDKNYPNDSLQDRLLKSYPELKKVNEDGRSGILHRLDRETSGLVIIAKNSSVYNFLKKSFIEGKIEKKYLVLAVGNIKENQGTIDTLIGRSKKDPRKQKVYSFGEPVGPERKLRKAVTNYKVLERFKDFTLVEAYPKTGRMHQIRVHFGHIQHPVAGDKKYGFRRSVKIPQLNRLFLHASYLRIPLPNGEIKEFSSKLPEDLSLILEKLAKRGKDS